MKPPKKQAINFAELAKQIKIWARELGFNQAAITDTELGDYNQRLSAWLAKGFHGEMDYMAKHQAMRHTPKNLVPNTQSVVVVRLDYLPENPNIVATLKNKNKAYISRYANGRDYHKLIRKRLSKLADKINQTVGEFNYRAFADSAPVQEKPLAEKAGLGWIGKSTNLINRQAGSWFFLGALFTDLPLPTDQSVSDHCGSCQACIDICPTQAIVAPYQLDARRCISYLTIELRGSIPVELRSLMGNRIYGCDDCQLVCPWNKFAKPSNEPDFQPRHNLDTAELIDLFNWTEAEFYQKTEGSAIRRIGYECWLRNIAVALGNAPTSDRVINALIQKSAHESELVREHVQWALAKHQSS